MAAARARTSDNASAATLPWSTALLVALPIPTTVALAIAMPWDDHGRLSYAIANTAVVCLLIAVLRRHKVALGNVGVRTPRPVDGPLAVAGLLAGFVAYGVAVAINALVGTPMQTAVLHPNLTALGLLIQALYAVVVAPAAEELIYRGFLISFLEGRGLSTGRSAALSVLLFAGVHLPGFGVGGFVFILLWAPIPTTLFLVRRSLAPGWMMHAANNAWAYLALPLIS
jgi:membrane protease YdiL (CAAX protease family)